MCPDEPVAAPRAWLARPSIDGEPRRESAALALCVEIIAEAGPARLDGLSQHADDRVAKRRGFTRAEGGGATGRVDSGPPQSLVRVDVPYSGDGLLVHQHLF